jgi:predicted transposase YbfD/YdcC
MPQVGLLAHFSDLPDPRVRRCRHHALMDILTICLLAVLCGAEGWEDIATFGRAKETWLKQRLGLGLEHGIPSHDTFRRVFSKLDPARFGDCFRSWVETLREQTRGQVIALDGQVLRRSLDRAVGQDPIHLVRAWATDEQLVLGTVKVGEGTNEIPAVSTLLLLLDIRGCIVTADAMHCQKETVAQIRVQGGDYLLSLKQNQPHLRADVALCFSTLGSHPAAPAEWQRRAQGRCVSTHTQSDAGHQREETRTIQVLTLAPEDPDWKDVQDQWRDLRSLVFIRRTRLVHGVRSEETVFYISSLAITARKLGRAARRHWHVENRLHWVLDVQMNQDASRIRRDHAPENFALLRSTALNLLRQDKSRTGGVKARQKLAGWDNDYLLQLVA